MDSIISLAVTLFILSMINERILNFIKLKFSGGKLMGVPLGNLKTKSRNEENEDTRDKNLLQLNLICGFIVSLLLRADMISLLKHVGDPANGIGWDTLKADNGLTWNLVTLIPGCFLTGCFLSLGSKFWHDLLDIVLQIKNLKRVLNDQETMKVDSIKMLDRRLDRVPSDFIAAAYLKIKQEWFDNPNIKAISLQNDHSGYFFEIMVLSEDSSFPAFYRYDDPEGGPESIPVKIILIGDDEIVPHSIHLGNKIANKNSLTNWGTLGCIVTKNDETSGHHYILTCYHNVVEPGSGYQFHADTIGVESPDMTGVNIGTATDGIRDNEIDAALIRIENAQVANILNDYPGGLGHPQNQRKLTNAEVKEGVFASMYGAASGNKFGTVTSIYTSVKVKYGDAEHAFVNLIAVSRNGKAISAPGDSGSCVLDENNALLGMLVAGNSKVSYVIPAATIFSKLNIHLIES